MDTGKIIYSEGLKFEFVGNLDKIIKCICIDLIYSFKQALSVKTKCDALDVHVPFSLLLWKLDLNVDFDDKIYF